MTRSHMPWLDGSLDRRRFLGLTGGVAAAGMLGGIGLSPSAFAAAQADFGDPATRTLVVIDMEGGNDALNTLVPQAGRYHDLRPTIGLDDDELLTFAGLDYGVHPALADLESFWDAGQVAGFYGIGLPDQSRSHFVAQDALRSALPGTPATSGWLGRWLEDTAPADEVPLRAIALGRDTLAARGESGRAVAVQSIDDYQLSPPNGNAAVIDAMIAMGQNPGTGLFGQAQSALPDTVTSVNELQSIVATVAGDSDEFGPDPSATLFAATQAIIQADVGTQVLYITVDGFDTHAGQPQRQAPLLETVATGLRQLFDGLAETGHADRTLVLAVSEFGRRAEENGSAGTDHGNGGLGFLIGPAVRESTIHGGADLDDLVNGDLARVIDTRSVYENALRWLGGPADTLRSATNTDTWSELNVLRSL